MNYGEFSSVVQLGVSLHLGTALLQFYGDLGVQPLVRSINRIKGLFSDAESQPSSEVEAALSQLESDFEIFKIRLFHEYRKYIIINSGVALLLTGILVALAYLGQTPISESCFWITIVMVSLSILPAPVTLFALSMDASRILGPLRKSAEALEQRAERGH